MAVVVELALGPEEGSTEATVEMATFASIEVQAVNQGENVDHTQQVCPHKQQVHATRTRDIP